MQKLLPKTVIFYLSNNYNKEQRPKPETGKFLKKLFPERNEWLAVSWKYLYYSDISVNVNLL